MALFMLDELARLSRTELDTASAEVARTLATGIVANGIGRKPGQPVESATLTEVLRVDRDSLCIDLPRRPVAAVASVAVDGVELAESAWEWNPGRPRVWLLAAPSWAGREPVASVTYTGGWTVIPDDIRAVALSVAARVYRSADGLRSVSIDDYSETRAGSDEDLAGVSLLKGERAILDSYRRRTASVSMW